MIGSELEASKVAKATEHLAEAGLADYVEIRAGDARQTLKDTGGAIDLLFLDGWKELYLELLHFTSAHLRPGSVVLADDTDLFPEHLASYLEFVRNPQNGFVSVHYLSVTESSIRSNCSPFRSLVWLQCAMDVVDRDDPSFPDIGN